MFTSLFRACLALTAALWIGCSFPSFCPLLWWLVILTSTGLDWGLSLFSTFQGNRKLRIRFSNFPDAVWTVAALISLSVLEMSSSTMANFQVPHGELSFRSTMSPFVGCIEDCVLGAFKCFWVHSHKLSTYSSNHSFQNMSRCFWPLCHMSKSFWEELNLLRKSGSCCWSSSAKDGMPVWGLGWGNLLGWVWIQSWSQLLHRLMAGNWPLLCLLLQPFPVEP